MSYEIDLIELADQENGHNIGSYSSRLARYWLDGLGHPMGELHGRNADEAAPLLAQGVRRLLAQGDAYAAQSFEGEYEEATLALLAIWKHCRENPSYTLAISY